MTRKGLLAVFLSLFLMLTVATASFAAGYYTGSAASRGYPLAQVLSSMLPQAPAEPAAASPDDQLEILRQVWMLIDKEFYKQPVDHAALLREAIKGMLNALGDPHTVYLDPRTSQRQREQTAQVFSGIGARIMEQDGRIHIQAVFPDSPAQKAGLQAGDVIVKVDGISIAGLGADEVAQRVRGREGTPVVLTVQRGGSDPVDLTVTRGRVFIPSISTKVVGENVGYIQLWTFGARTTDELRNALREMNEKRVQGLILDLRGNPGGLLDTALNVASQFLPEGTVILYEQRGDGQLIPYKAQGSGLGRDLPMVILVNRYSASASEIVAGALAEHGRALVIGERTYGKGSVQLPHNLKDGSQVRITVARWLTPKQQSISDKGVTPDIEVLASAGDDAILQRALAELARRATLPKAS